MSEEYPKQALINMKRNSSSPFLPRSLSCLKVTKPLSAFYSSFRTPSVLLPPPPPFNIISSAILKLAPALFGTSSPREGNSTSAHIRITGAMEGLGQIAQKLSSSCELPPLHPTCCLRFLNLQWPPWCYLGEWLTSTEVHNTHSITGRL